MMTLHTSLKKVALGLFASGALIIPAGFAIANGEDIAPVQLETMHSQFLTTAPSPINSASLCMVDTGVNLTPETTGAIASRTTVDGTSVDDNHSQLHGTLIASAIAGPRNGYGSIGMWPAIRIHSVRVTDDSGAVSMRRIAAGIDRCREMGASVIEIAQAGSSISGLEADMQSAVDRAKAADIVVVAGAGNNNGGPVQYPAALPGVIGVGAGTDSGAYCAISARGPEVDIVAPGCDLSIATPEGSQVTGLGTSFASAYVATAATALRAYTGMSSSQVEQTLLSSAANLEAGRTLDVAAAFKSTVAASLVGVNTIADNDEDEEEEIIAPTAKKATKAVKAPTGVKATWKSRKGLVVKAKNKTTSVSFIVKARGATTTTRKSVVTMRVAKVKKIKVAFVDKSGKRSSWVTVTVR